MKPELLLDITRLMRRAGRVTPTGIDRVEMAYADHLARYESDRLIYAAFHPGGWHVRLPHAMAARFLDETARQWRGEPTRVRVTAARLWLRTLFTLPRSTSPVRRAAYLLLSHTNLERPAAVARALAIEHASLVCLVHDLIPLTHPEFSRIGMDRMHRRRLDTVEALADIVITNSLATEHTLSTMLGRRARSVRMLAAPLGVTLPDIGLQPRYARPPYFVMLGTIEPRKNHVLLLQVWQRLVSIAGPAQTPQLVLIGRDGWENAHVMALLQRAPALQGVVTLANDRSDREVALLLRDARALLMPSFAEGFGLPVAEALALGVPVVASDLPALRETGRDVPEYLDPMDGPAWLQAVHDYAQLDSPRRSAQLERMVRWTMPTWEEHCRVVLDAIDALPYAAPTSPEARLAA